MLHGINLMRFSFTNRLHINFLKTVRGRLIIGLLPGLLALITLLAIGLLATDILVSANQHLAEAGEELAATRLLQLRLQQVMVPLFDALAHEDNASATQFLQLAADLDQVFNEVEPHYGEADEQALFADIHENWHHLRTEAEGLLADSSKEDASQREQTIQESAMSLNQQLEELTAVVSVEMQKTVANGQAAHDTASALLIGSTLIAFLLGLVFIWLFPDYLTRPLVALREGAARIGSGDLNYRLTIQRYDEFGILAREFNLMAERLSDSRQHMEDRVAERTEQLWALNEASRSVVRERQIDRVLQTIADLARDLGDADHAAVMAPRQEPETEPRFIVSPAGNEITPQSSPFLASQELLETLLHAEMPIRIEDVHSHPSAAGFPPGHLAMHSFLGLPIRIHGRTIGGLYLTNKRHGLYFSEEDERILSMLAAYAGIAIENARLYHELTQMNEELEQRVQERTAELEAVSAERTRYAARLRQVLNRDMQVQETERQRIAKDIHDGVSQWLMGAMFELQAARVRLPADAGEVERHLAETQNILKAVKEEMRRVIHDLHPPLLESNGLVTALRNYVQEMEAHSTLIVHFQVTGDPVRLPAPQELVLFRIGQEALTNVRKHARTESATLSLTFSEATVRLCVADLGAGFASETETSASRVHLGLLSMRERAAAVGATLTIKSAPEQGARICITVPNHPSPSPLTSASLSLFS